MTASAIQIAEKLGGAHTIGRRIRSLNDLRHAVEDGLPVRSLEPLAGYLGANVIEAADVKNRIVPRTALRRRTRLSVEEGERTERLARLAALAEQVWEDADLAREFLTSPQPQLAGERPIDLARTEPGAREVEELLMKIEYALPA
jgi:putative toxin-antitoxin system antitoxin component (TIGR02293 family)